MFPPLGPGGPPMGPDQMGMPPMGGPPMMAPPPQPPALPPGGRLPDQETVIESPLLAAMAQQLQPPPTMPMGPMGGPGLGGDPMLAGLGLPADIPPMPPGDGIPPM